MRSLTYYLILSVIKLTGVKKKFSADPIDYAVLRQEDVHSPKNRYFKKNERTKSFQVLNTVVTEIRSKKSSDKLLLFFHGGAFVYGPVQHHWDTIEKISRETGHVIWMCDYPKAPEHKIAEISRNVDEVYKQALQTVAPHNLICIGDSVGATLVISLTQRLVMDNGKLPAQLFLISPVLDASFSNSDIQPLEKKDPILSRKGVLSAKLMCADNGDLMDPKISPLHGSFHQFPETILFAAEHDITYPDQLLFIKELRANEVKYALYVGEQMPHIWPLLPVMKESKDALHQIIKHLNHN